MKCRRVRPTLMWTLFVSVYFCHSLASAQQFGQDSPPARVSASSSFLPVPLEPIWLPLPENAAWPENPETLNLQIVSLPSNTRVLRRDIRSVKYGPDRRSLLIELSQLFQAPPGDNRLSVSLGEIDDQLPSAEASTAAQGAFARAELANYDRQRRQSIAVEKTSEEKSFDTQFQIASPGGGVGTLNLNKAFKPGFLNQIILDVSFGKGGSKTADPKYFDVGLTFRKILLGSEQRKEIEELRRDLRANRQSNSLESMKSVERASRLPTAKPKPQWFINYGGLRLETDLRALRPGPVNNLLYTGGVELRSPRRQIGSDSSLFFWSFRLIPATLEAGKNLRNKDNIILQKYPIARLKGESDFKLFFRSPCRYDTWFSGIIFEANFTDRYLLKKESAFDRLTNRNDLVAKGNQYSLQFDLKVMTGINLPEDLRFLKPLKYLKIPKLGRHPALTFTYRRGGVPPVFAFNNAFKIGFSLESSDDNNASDLGNIIPGAKSP